MRPPISDWRGCSELWTAADGFQASQADPALLAFLRLSLMPICGFLRAGLPSMKATFIAATAVVLCATLVVAQFGGGGPGMTRSPQPVAHAF